MNKLGSAFLALLFAAGCAKKAAPKPVHTEPWLAHPVASAASSPDAALALTRYVLTPQSLIRVELSTKRGKVRAKISRVSGEFQVALGALRQSRGQLRADLSSLSLEDNEDAASAPWLARARSALELVDAGAPSAQPALASFEITALQDVSPDAIEPAPAPDGGASGTRRVRASAEGNLLLNGFRVFKRQALEAEFGFNGDPAVPVSVMIRSRAPLVVSLDAHGIQLGAPATTEGTRRRHGRPSVTARDVRVSVELYGKKD